MLTVACYNTATITAVKSFIEDDPEVKQNPELELSMSALACRTWLHLQKNWYIFSIIWSVCLG